MTRTILLKWVGFIIVFVVKANVGVCQQQQTIIMYPDSLVGGLNSNVRERQQIEHAQSIQGVAIKKVIVKLDKPTHFFNATKNIHPNGSSSEQIDHFLVMPGDSVVIDRDMKVIFSRKNSLNIDRFMTTQIGYISDERQIVNLIKKKGLTGFLNDVDEVYNENENQIQKSALANDVKEALSNFNYILKCKKQVSMPYASLLPKSKKLLDSTYTIIGKDHSKLTMVDSQFENTILYKLLNYYLLKNQIKGDLWSNLDRLSTFPFLKRFIINGLIGADSFDPKRRDQLYGEVKRAKVNDRQIDSIYLALRDRLPTVELKALQNLEQILLVSKEGKKVTLKEVLDKSKRKLLFIDFWASWCVPCRTELPKLKLMQQKFKNTSVLFVNFSIDLDNKNADWIKALSEDKELDNPNQYRLLDWKNSGLAKLISLRSIPRYILMDTKGKILNSNFPRPSHAKFEEELRKYLKI